MRIPVYRTVESDAPERVSGALAPFVPWGATHPQAKLDVLPRRHPGEERVFLKNNTTVRAGLLCTSAPRKLETLPCEGLMKPAIR